ncbi:hypothetical protein [Cohnella nanjingensis]|uniref:Uncharacterized protein n=1 Tax=Cohnella nanjingensis TaxID=1387779 RepID=A0A7X0RRK6_9BACL|nr:hypothetical protein [Cohnella nanjingensis]MBB6672363.1 hypothetical protein [Cohnella nanjingensis]
MSNTVKTSADGSYLFQVEILVNASTNGAALEQLLHALNEGSFADYRIQSGIRLGETIEETLEQASGKSQVLTETLDARIRQYIQTSRLIRVQVNKGKGVKLSMPCRVVNFDPDNELLTLYHVDEKRVYSIQLNEIDDFIAD